jgi:hypothetical protein
VPLPYEIFSPLKTDLGTYTPDFEFPDFYVEVKSRFTYDVLIGKSSYSKNKKSNPNQLEKLIYISKNVKKVRICLVEGEIFNYIDL